MTSKLVLLPDDRLLLPEDLMRMTDQSGIRVKTVWMDYGLIGHIRSSCRSYVNFFHGRPNLSSLVGQFGAMKYTFLIRRLHPSVSFGTIVLSDQETEEASFHFHERDMVELPADRCPYKLCVVESVTDA